MKIIFVVNSLEFFISHRLPIAITARDCGYTVHIASMGSVEVEKIKNYGFVHHRVPFTRRGQNPFVEFRAFIYLYRLFKDVQPDLVHLITIKPVLYGGIAARMARIKSVVVAITGLGTVFIAQTKMAIIRRRLISLMYNLAIGETATVIFQNLDDRNILLKFCRLKLKQVRIIKGSGVDLDSYRLSPQHQGVPVVVMAARLLRDKGVFEFIEAARILRLRSVPLKMRLIGEIDQGNPTSVSESEMELWRKEGVVELIDYSKNIPHQYAAANIVCLPSYREGLPKGLVEAAACGRAVITTDVPGCCDAIVPGVTGILVPVRNATALADAIQDLIERPLKRKKMGEAGRKLAEQEFGIKKIVEQHMNIYKELLTDA
ncbi:glycosyltransferase family 4 protein [Neptunomonas antarctica]|uniref:glycosyltransferase family 4 protein n=1 Tax=Neptunomonas antarctica TaxID=619304 RepID=UPI0006C7D234|nr:glycosyltransferase family 4 protein [Neptunomonas antarctica]